MVLNRMKSDSERTRSGVRIRWCSGSRRTPPRRDPAPHRSLSSAERQNQQIGTGSRRGLERWSHARKQTRGTGRAELRDGKKRKTAPGGRVLRRGESRRERNAGEPVSRANRKEEPAGPASDPEQLLEAATQPGSPARPCHRTDPLELATTARCHAGHGENGPGAGAIAGLAVQSTNRRSMPAWKS
jgi:hypothetical protein